jgi:hypothetical protein
VFVVIRTNIWRIKNLEFRIWRRVRRLPMRVNLRWRSGHRAGRARLSETAGSSAIHRPIWPNVFASRNGSRPNRGSYVPGPAVSERHALPGETRPTHAARHRERLRRTSRRSRSDMPYLISRLMPRCDPLLTSAQKIALCCASKCLAFLTEAGSRQATLRSIPLSTYIL